VINVVAANVPLKGGGVVPAERVYRAWIDGLRCLKVYGEHLLQARAASTQRLTSTTTTTTESGWSTTSNSATEAAGVDETHAVQYDLAAMGPSAHAYDLAVATTYADDGHDDDDDDDEDSDEYDDLR
jgi:hypothetical protein